MGDMMMYAVIAGIAAGAFFLHVSKKVSGGDYKPIELKNCRYAVRKLQNLLPWAPLSMIL